MIESSTKPYRKIATFVFALAVLTSCSTSSLMPLQDNQLPNTSLETVWEKTFKSWSAEDLLALPDGGFVLAGGVMKEERYEKDVLVARFNEGGELLWQKNFDIDTDRRFQIEIGGSRLIGSSEFVHSIEPLDDGGFIVSGRNGQTGSTAWLLRLDENGEQLWLNPYGGLVSSVSAMAVLPDGSLIIAGRKLTNYPYDYPEGPDDDAWIARVRSDGEVIWDRTYDNDIGGDTAGVSSINVLGNGYLYVTIELDDAPQPYRRVKLDLDGRAVEQHVLDVPDKTFIHEHLTMPEGGLVVALGAYRDPVTPSILMLNAAGDALWETTFPGQVKRFNHHLNALTSLPGGQIALTVGRYKNNETDETSGAIIFFDDKGEILSTHLFQSDHFTATNFEVLSDGTYISAGYKQLKKEHPDDDDQSVLWLQKLAWK